MDVVGSKTSDKQARAQIMRMTQAGLVAQLLAVVAELGVADLVADQPRPVAELAASTGTDPDALYRALRALASVGVFTEARPRTFGATDLSDTLRSGVPGSLRAWTQLCGRPERIRAVENLIYSVRTGLPAFDHVYGTDWWSRMSGNPEHSALFNDAMGDLARQTHAAAVATYDLSGVRHLVDVGGGHGHLVSTVLPRYPEMTAVVYDQPHVVPGADEVLTGAGVRDRAELVGGDFFTSVPAGADAYLLSMILHDWTDEQCVKILSNIREAMDPAGRVLVIDAVLPDGDVAHPGKVRDILMLALLPGRERTESEFAELLAAAGLRHVATGLLVAERV